VLVNRRYFVIDLVAKSFGLFIATAVAEIAGCYLPYLWLKKGASPWLLFPAACSLACFVWLLTLHPTAAGRVYAAYGGVYIGVAILWLWIVESTRPTAWDLAGVFLSLTGMAVIIVGAQSN
jgi:small multidrug resistance family-3 protein